MLFRREDGAADFRDDLWDDPVTKGLKPSTSGGGSLASQSSGAPINCATQAGLSEPRGFPLALLLARSGGPASQESRITCAWMFGVCLSC